MWEKDENFRDLICRNIGVEARSVRERVIAIEREEGPERVKATRCIFFEI